MFVFFGAISDSENNSGWGIDELSFFCSS